MRIRRLCYETDIEQVKLDEYWLRRHGYMMKGFHLPDEAIRKIYHAKAERLIPALAKTCYCSSVGSAHGSAELPSCFSCD